MIRFLFVCAFTIYIAMSGIVFLFKLPAGHIWFNQWIFDKFYVFQFISVITVGLAIEGSYFNQLSYVRMENRRQILKRELLGYYTLGLLCLSIMFLFIILGALLLREQSFMLQLTDWYFRYLLGVIIFANIMSCLKCTNNRSLRRHCTIMVFSWMALELLVFIPFIEKFSSLDTGLLFSWVFHKGSASYYWMIGIVLITLLLNIRINEKRDFI